MLKSEFIKKVQSMKKPVLTFQPTPYGDLADWYGRVGDESDIRNKFELPVVRLSGKEYARGGFASYDKRETAMVKKYKRWFKEAIEKGEQK